MENGNARQYEIINKETKEIFPVTRLGSGDVDGDQDNDFIVHLGEEEIVFTQPGYVNETYLVRDAESKLSPNGVDLVLLEGEVAPGAASTDGGADVTPEAEAATPSTEGGEATPAPEAPAPGTDVTP